MEAGDVCIPNIGPRERRRRLIGGVGVFAFGAIAAALLIAFGVQRAWRIALFVPMWGGALGLLQVKEKTCVALVARREQNLDGGNEAVDDPEVLAQMKRQARKVHVRAVLLALAITTAILAV
jgi:hypothetical protein